jgi:hypothetical protein
VQDVGGRLDPVALADEVRTLEERTARCASGWRRRTQAVQRMLAPAAVRGGGR